MGRGFKTMKTKAVFLVIVLLVVVSLFTSCTSTVLKNDARKVSVTLLVKTTDNEEVEKVSPGLTAYGDLVEKVIVTVRNEQGDVVFQQSTLDKSKSTFDLELPGYGKYKFTVEAVDSSGETVMKGEKEQVVDSTTKGIVLYYTTFNPYGTYYTYYKAYVIPIYKALYKIIPFFEYSSFGSTSWIRSTPTLYEIRKPYSGYPSIVLIHGIDSSEINGVWTDYKKDMIQKWNKYIPAGYGLYFFAYPTLDVPLDYSARVLAQSINTLGSTMRTKFYFFAHSMGGLLLRYALQDSTFRSYVVKVVFSGTPHIGSPLGNLVVMNKNDLSNRGDWTLIKDSLILANMAGVFVEAPNYRYLVYGVSHPLIPSGVIYKTFAGVVPTSDLGSLVSSAWSNGITNVLGHSIVASLMVKVFGADFSKNDGAVPLQSASAFGNTEILNGYTHADLASNPTVISKAFYFFFGKTLSIDENLLGSNNTEGAIDTKLELNAVK
jgi:pimeloyl-ACP methyl ester carboxylesterase